MILNSAQQKHLLRYFLNKHVTVETHEGITVEGILLYFRPSKKNPHLPFVLVLLTKHGKAIMRDFRVVKLKVGKVEA